MKTLLTLFVLLFSSSMVANCISGDCVNGYGTYILEPGEEWEGDKYVGEFKNNECHGLGTYTYAKGDKYIGEFKDGKRNGLGTYTYGQEEWEGDKYVGEYKNNARHGQGTYTSADGEVARGIWENDEFVTPN